MRQRSRENQQLMADRIIERFDAVDVTGLSRWEKERALVKAGWYDAGLEAGAARQPRLVRDVRPSAPASSSAKQDPLFPDLEDAA